MKRVMWMITIDMGSLVYKAIQWHVDHASAWAAGESILIEESTTGKVKQARMLSELEVKAVEAGHEIRGKSNSELLALFA